MLKKANMFYWLFLWRGTEVVVTGLTRNQFGVICLTWVRIPLSLPIISAISASFKTEKSG